MAKDDCDAIMFDTFLEPVYQGNKLIYILCIIYYYNVSYILYRKNFQ